MASTTTTTTMIGKPIGTIAYGAMNLTWVSSPPSLETSFATLRQALASGANFWNAGEFYGPPDANSNVLLAKYFEKYPDDAEKVVLFIKGGLVPGKFPPVLDGSAAGIRRSVEDSIKQLQGRKTIDLFECARVDKKVPIEDQMETMLKLKEEGKIGGIGLSEVSAETIRRAAKVGKVDVVEVELSLFATDVLYNGIAKTCGELGIPLLGFSALGHGALAGKMPRANSEIAEDDHRKHIPKFQDDVLENNWKLIDEVRKLADKKGVTPGQIALGWHLKLSNSTMPDGTKLGTIIPLPGASNPARAKENSTRIELSDDEMREIWDVLEKNPIKGDRYPESIAGLSEY